MNLRSIAAAILAQPETPSKMPEGLSSYERFGYPYRFQPVLSLSDAAMLALRAFLRIFLLSTLFGTWGAGATVVWNGIHNPYLRAAALAVLTMLLVAIAVGMLVTTARIGRQRSRLHT